MKAVRKSIIATSLLAALPGLSQALGLGGIDVKSGLNEPLVAEIQVIVAAPDEKEGLSVGLARPEDFANVGLDYSRVAMPLDFAVTTNAKGDTIIRVTSQDVVREPFLSLLLEVNWAKGRLLREYSLLLDPPVMASVRKGSTAQTQPVAEAVTSAPEPMPMPVQTAPPPEPIAAEPVTAEPIANIPEPAQPPPEPVAVQPEPAAAEPLAATEPTAEPVAAEPEVAPPEPVAAEPVPVAASVGGEYGPVVAGDNLYAIAQKVRTDSSVSIDQLMVSILRMNSQAFYQDNINALKTGAILRIPSASELVSAEEAKSAVQEHNQLWTGYQARSSENPALVSDSGSASVAGSSSGTTSTVDRLELVAPGSSDGQGGADRPNGRADAASAEQLRKVRDDLAVAKEELSSAQRESTELGSRVKELERLQGDQARLISLKDDRIAELERRIKEMDETVATAAAQPEPSPVKQPEPVETTPEPATPPAVASADPVTTEPPVSEPVGSDTAATTAPGGEITKEDIWGQSLADAKDPGTDPTSATDPATSADPATELPVDPATTADPASVADSSSSAAAEPVAAEPATSEPTVTPITEPVTPAPEPIAAAPAEEPGFLELYWPWLAGGGGVLLLLALLAMMRKKKPAPVQVENDNYGEHDNLGDSLGFPAPAPVGGIPTPPPFEAFNADPEMALRAGIESDPDDLQCHLELLRLFHRRRDAHDFEDAAQAMLARISDPSLSAEWQEVRMMGEDLVPNSSLFARLSDFDTLDLPALDTRAGSSASGNDDGLGDLDFGSFDAPPAPAPAASFAARAEEPAAFDFNLDLDGPTRKVEPIRVEVAAAPAPAEDLSFDFNFDLDAAPAPAPAPAPVHVAPAPAPAPAPSFEPPTLDLPDFDFSSDIKPVEKMSFEPTELESPVVTSRTADLSSPEIIREPELPAFDDALFSSDDAVGTKLDLARAYLDMGDPDGARSMLEEVMAEGDDMQRNEARELLGRLG